MDDTDFEPGLEPVVRGELSRIRTVLEYRTYQEKVDALHDLVKLKQHAKPLLPLINEAFSHGERWLSSYSMVRLLDATEDPSILRALQESSDYPKLGISDKLICFRHGAN